MTVQRSRLPMIALPLDRGLSDTNGGEANHNYSSKQHTNWRFVAHPRTQRVTFDSMNLKMGNPFYILSKPSHCPLQDWAGFEVLSLSPIGMSLGIFKPTRRIEEQVRL